MTPDTRGSRPGQPGQEAPILLIHGFLCLQSFMRPAQWLLARRGLRTHLVDLSPLCVQDIRQLAQELGQNVERVLAREGAARCDLVGISQGGFIALAYAQGPAARGKVRRIVALGTPFRGASVSGLADPLLGALLPGLRQVVPGSEFLQELEQGGIPADVQVTTLSISGDPIAPPDRCQLQGAHNIRLRGLPTPLTHQALILAPVAIKALAQALR